MADGFPHPGSHKGPKVAVDRLPRRERRGRRHMAPLAPGAHDIEQTVQQAPHVGRPGPPTGLRRRDERLDQAVLVIAQGLAGAKVSDQCANFGRPHRCLRKGGVSHPNSHQHNRSPSLKWGWLHFQNGQLDDQLTSLYPQCWNQPTASSAVTLAATLDRAVVSVSMVLAAAARSAVLIFDQQDSIGEKSGEYRGR
jgi:hypothetical protein